MDGVDNIMYPIKLFKALNIPYSVVLDRDFFTDYLKGTRKESVNGEGFFEYTNRIKESNVNIIEEMIGRKEISCDLNKVLDMSYAKLFDYLKEYKIYSMRYCLEQDMVTSSKFRDICYKEFNIQKEDKSTYNILVKNSKGLKKYTFLLKSIKEMKIKEYPYTIGKISNALISDIDSILEDHSF